MSYLAWLLNYCQWKIDSENGPGDVAMKTRVELSMASDRRAHESRLLLAQQVVTVRRFESMHKMEQIEWEKQEADETRLKREKRRLGRDRIRLGFGRDPRTPWFFKHIEQEQQDYLRRCLSQLRKS